VVEGSQRLPLPEAQNKVDVAVMGAVGKTAPHYVPGNNAATPADAADTLILPPASDMSVRDLFPSKDCKKKLKTKPQW